MQLYNYSYSMLGFPNAVSFILGLVIDLLLVSLRIANKIESTDSEGRFSRSKEDINETKIAVLV